MMMSWADSPEREEVSELSQEIWYIDDRSLSLVEGGGRGRRLSGGFLIKDSILLNILCIYFIRELFYYAMSVIYYDKKYFEC